MSEQSKEHISSLMDGEISPETSRFLVRRLGADRELCATWARYHLVRDCLRNADVGLYGADLCVRVNRALGDEPAVGGRVRVGRSWLRPVAGGAIAATVALAALILVDPGRAPATQAPVGVANVEPAASFVNPEGLSGLPASRAASLGANPGANTRINHYLLRHYQATGGRNGAGIVSFVPVMVQQRAAADPAAEPGAIATGDVETGSRTGQ